MSVRIANGLIWTFGTLKAVPNSSVSQILVVLVHRLVRPAYRPPVWLDSFGRFTGVVSPGSPVVRRAPETNDSQMFFA